MKIPEYRTAAQLAADTRPTGPIHPGCYLHYNGPGSTGFGVKRTAMLMPETAMLMISPMGCGRSGTVVAEQFGFAHRMFYLNLDDRSVASGSYLRRIPEAARYIAGLGKFKAILLCMSCIDALTGTDPEGIGRTVRRETGLGVATTFMDPIVRDGNYGPMVQVRQAITSCFERGPVKEDTVNVLGTFAPLAPDSELHQLLSPAGIQHISTVAGCRTFEELQAMGQSRCNLVIHPQATACGKDLEKRLNMPWQQMFTSYRPEQIAREYDALGEFLNTTLDYQPFEARARQKMADFARRRRGARIAVGESVCGSPFDIALLLLSLGIQVPFVFRDRLQPWDAPALAQLAQQAPELPIYSGVHPETARWAEALPRADLALGLDAGYFCPQGVSVAWPWEKAWFGFEALEALLDLLEEGLDAPKGHREQMQGSYLTV